MGLVPQMVKVYMFVNVAWFFVSHRLPIATEARERGYDMTVLADMTDRCPQFFTEGFKFSRSTIRRRSGVLRVLFDFYKTFKLILNANVDILHAVPAKPILFIGITAVLLRKPFIASVSGLGPAFSKDGIFGLFRRAVVVRLYKIIFSNPRSRVIVQTDHDREVLLGSGICASNQVETIRGSGVDLDQFNVSDSNYSSVKTNADRNLHVLSASRLLSDKGIMEYLQAADMMRAEGSDAQFLLAGPFDHESPTALDEAYIHAQCKSTGVRYLGNVTDMAALLKTIDLFVYPTYYPEGLPKILLEVAAAGIPVVTTNHPGCRDAVVNGQSGILVEPRNASDLKRACSQLLADELLRDRMSRFSVAHARTNFDVKQVVEKHFALYEKLVGSITSHRDS